MAIKRAKTLNEHQVTFALLQLSLGENPERDKVLFLLSFKNALRAAEIAGLTWAAVTTPEGSLAKDIEIGSHIGKGKKGRTIPMHPLVKEALTALRMVRPEDEFVAYSVHPHHDTMSANAVTLWFKRLYRDLGFEGCSSHSGRRTAITNAARKANLFDCSLVDVQQLAGHARLDTTERYIDFSERAPEMVAAI